MTLKLKAHLLNGCANFAERCKGKVRAFDADKKGVAAIEFALLAPMMIMMYFGLAEIAYAISFDRKVSHAANVAGDLATQVTQIPAADMNEILTATLKVISVNDIANVKLEIASYDLDSDGDARLLGRATLNGAGPQEFKPFDPDNLDSRILSETSGVVVARIAYEFEPIKYRYLNGKLNLRDNFLLKPRRSASVQIGDAIGAEINCTASTPDDVNCGGVAVE